MAFYLILVLYIFYPKKKKRISPQIQLTRRVVAPKVPQSFFLNPSTILSTICIYFLQTSFSFIIFFLVYPLSFSYNNSKYDFCLALLVVFFFFTISINLDFSYMVKGSNGDLKRFLHWSDLPNFKINLLMTRGYIYGLMKS